MCVWEAGCLQSGALESKSMLSRLSILNLDTHSSVCEKVGCLLISVCVGAKNRVSTHWGSRISRGPPIGDPILELCVNKSGV